MRYEAYLPGGSLSACWFARNESNCYNPAFGGYMDIVALLKAERDKVAQQLNGLNAALAAFAGSYTDGANRPRRRRKLSAQGLANIRAAQRARRQRERRNPKTPSNRAPKRRISAAGRARIAAAARARWAKVKAKQKS